MKIRIKFRKYGAMKFIGHLDMMRFFQKAAIRSGIEVCYTEGFSPHQKMSFAAPLGVGITSDGEYLDIEVHASGPSREAVANLNAAMVEGIEVIGYVRLPDKAKTAMSAVAAADYEIWYKDGYEVPGKIRDFPGLQKALQDFYIVPKEVPVTKKTKKSEKTLDLKQLVYDFKVLPPQEYFMGNPAFYLNVSTGSTDNLKPELVLEAFYHSMGLEYNPYALQIHRKDVYYRDANGRYMPLLQEGEEIA